MENKDIQRIAIKGIRLGAEIAPGEGGRLARLWWRLRNGVAVDIVVPLTTGLQGSRWPKAGGYPLIPYGNRIANGKLSFLGNEIDITPHPDAIPHSLHGHTQLEAWEVAAVTEHSITIRYEGSSRNAWPWAIEAQQEFVIHNDVLQVILSVRNLDERTMPAGLGWHPYFTTAYGEQIEFSACRWWPHGDDYVPTGEMALLSAALESPLSITSRELTAYLSGIKDATRITRSDGLVLTMKADPIFEHLVLHYPENAPYLCVEPSTHVANGFNMAAKGIGETGTRVLDPGECLTGAITLAITDRNA